MVASFKKIAKEERVNGCRLLEDKQGGESNVLPPSRRSEERERE